MSEKLYVYNTLSRKKEIFEPIKNTVTMYSCGPTVYNYAHIGNLRTYIFMDLLRRVLKFNGYKIKGVMNITDVGHLLSDSDDGEDKMVLASRQQKKTPREIADYFTEVFFTDTKKLNIGTPEIIAKATDNIEEMISYVLDLIESGHAYDGGDSIYFDISSFPSYGKLGRLNLESQIAGARVEVNSSKRHPADFALWKKADANHIMQWDSPWGKGYPGWHIECSAMSRKYLGRTMDIHTGGVDHIPIHHENEIAQSEAREKGVKTVNYWMHGEFMLVDGGKMSKSLGNTYTISDLEKKGYSPLAFRYFCLNAHYRKRLNFTFEGLEASAVALDRLYNLIVKHKNSKVTTDKEIIENYRKEFTYAVNDDLNIPLALGVLWTMLKNPESANLYNLCLEFDKILGLNLAEAEKFITIAEESETENIPEEAITLAEKRLLARKNKDFSESDRLRDEIMKLGFTVIDAKDSYTLKKI